MHPALKVFLVILGTLLLLPGVCGFIFIGFVIHEFGFLGFLLGRLPGLAIGVGGYFLIRHVLIAHPDLKVFHVILGILLLLPGLSSVALFFTIIEDAPASGCGLPSRALRSPHSASG